MPYSPNMKPGNFSPFFSLKVRPLLLLIVCGFLSLDARVSGEAPSPPQEVQDPANAPSLSAMEVGEIVRLAAGATPDTSLVVAVTDRAGRVLAVFRKPDAPELVPGNFGAMYDANEVAVSLARTGAFFSNDQAPLSSRTVRFISGIHFPPGIAFTPNAALYGIENTNRGCEFGGPDEDIFNSGKVVPRARSIDGERLGIGITTGKADLADSTPYPEAVNPGGIPLFKNGRVVGGVGVVLGPRGEHSNEAELAAFTAACPGLASSLPLPPPGVIYLDGIRLPFVDIDGSSLPPIPSDFRCPAADAAFAGGWVLEPRDGGVVPEDWLVGPHDGVALSAGEVITIITQAVERAERTRAAIRLPLGSRARMVIAVGDLDGTLLGLFRMPDATVFSIDVAVAKARNVVYFSSTALDPRDLPGVPPGTAVTNRTINFASQPLFPAGIGPGRGPFDPASAGPFIELYAFDTLNPCTQGRQSPNAKQNGIVFFPGSVPLYKGGRLAGGLGISGDGVEQDDYVAAGGARGFEPPPSIRADQIFLRGVRLPYLKFPRRPER